MGFTANRRTAKLEEFIGCASQFFRPPFVFALCLKRLANDWTGTHADVNVQQAACRVIALAQPPLAVIQYESIARANSLSKGSRAPTFLVLSHNLDGPLFYGLSAR